MVLEETETPDIGEPITEEGLRRMLKRVSELPTTKIDAVGLPLADFVKFHGKDCYQAVVEEFGGNADEARHCIETGFVVAGGSLGDYMEYRLFDLWAGELCEDNHPFLPYFIDYEGLAKARVAAGDLRVVMYKGCRYFFERRERKKAEPL